VLRAAHLKAHFPAAYAEAFAITAAQANDGVLVTGDPEFEAVKDVVRIEWIGERLPFSARSLEDCPIPIISGSQRLSAEGWG
jgi:hypothetical protein